MRKGAEGKNEAGRETEVSRPWEEWRTGASTSTPFHRSAGTDAIAAYRLQTWRTEVRMAE